MLNTIQFYHTMYLAGRLGIVTVVFKFSALCNDTQGLEMDSAETNRQVGGTESTYE